MTLEPQLASQLLLAFAGAVMGAALGAATRWGAMRSDRRLRLTLDLYAEFHAPEFNQLRIAAYDALEQSGGAMPEAYARASGDTRAAVSSVVHYWEKVALLSRIGALDERLLRRFLGQYARWWSPLLCERVGALDHAEWGGTLSDIHWLFERLKRGAKRDGQRP